MTAFHRSSFGRILLAARMLIVLLLLCAASAILTGGQFARIDNLVNVARQVSFEGLIAFGMTLVIVTGGIDLSVGSLVALTGVVAALVMQRCGGMSPTPAIALGLVCGIASGSLIGGTSGAIIARFAIPPFLVTLAVMLMARGMAFILCDASRSMNCPRA